MDRLDLSVKLPPPILRPLDSRGATWHDEASTNLSEGLEKGHVWLSVYSLLLKLIALF